MSIPLRVLLVEDSEDDATLLLRELRRSGFEPTWERHEDAAALTAALARQAWDIILCDYHMPAFSALAALELLQDLGLDLPVIVVSGEVGDEFALSALQAGARDYVCKDDLGSLGAVVLRELGRPDSRHSVRKELQARL
jgi:CheY-like chemotaxis protein